MEPLIKRQRGGRRPGAGRKSKAEQLGIVGLLDARLPFDKRQRIIDNLFKFAVGSNPKAAVSAAALLLAYAYGKPTETVKLDINAIDSEIERRLASLAAGSEATFTGEAESETVN